MLKFEIVIREEQLSDEEVKMLAMKLRCVVQYYFGKNFTIDKVLDEVEEM